MFSMLKMNLYFGIQLDSSKIRENDTELCVDFRIVVESKQ